MSRLEVKTWVVLNLWICKVMVDKFEYHDWWPDEHQIRIEWRW